MNKDPDFAASSSRQRSPSDVAETGVQSSIQVPRGLDFALLVGSALLLASSFVAIKIAVRELSPLGIAASRCSIAALLLSLWRGGPNWPSWPNWPNWPSWPNWPGRQNITEPSSPPQSSALHNAGSEAPPRPQDPWWLPAGVAIFGYALPFFAVAWAEQWLQSADTAILFSFGPVVALIIGYFWAKDEYTGPAQYLGLGIAVLGVLCCVYASTGGSHSHNAPGFDGLRGLTFLPALAILSAAIFYAVSGQLARQSVQDPLALTRNALILAALGLDLFYLGALLLAGVSLPQLSTGLLAAIVYLGAIPTAVVSVIRYQQIVKLGYVFVSNTGYLVPIFGFLLSALLLGEGIQALMYAGLTLAMLGLFVGQLRRANSPTPRD